MHAEAADKIRKARFKLVREHRFYAYNLSMLNVRERPAGTEHDADFQTMCTDSEYIFYNPDFVMQHSTSALATILAHEVLHVLAHHGTRGRGHIAELSALAADYAVNDLLLKGKFEPVKGWAYDPQYAGMSYEQIYKELLKKAQTRADERSQSNQKDGNGSSDSNQGTSDTGPETSDISKGSGDSSKEDESHDDEGGVGEAENRKPDRQNSLDEAIKELTDNVDTSFGNFVPPKNEKTLNQRKRETAQQIAKATNAIGMVDGEAGVDALNLERLIKQSREEKMPWHAILLQEITELSRNDYNWMVPSRRYMHTGFCLPSLHDQSMGTIGIFVDTSASISQDQLNSFATHITAIMTLLQPEKMIVIYCDHDIPKDGIQTFHRGEPLELEAKGGGGTDFVPPFEYIDKNRIELRCAIYFTDLQCARYPAKPSYSVYWVRKGNARWATTPPFGKVIGFE